MDISVLYQIALGNDIQPDDWQLTLAAKSWPQVLIAPTGSGKTAAVTLGWVAHRLRDRQNTPRRLVWCLPMRSLVEQIANEVRNWLEKLMCVADCTQIPRPEQVHKLMGGTDSGDWLASPELPAILVGTQDMLLSRALMRGYASSRALWPVEFALLHNDAQWVFDEVQLMGTGRATSAQLEAFRRTEGNRSTQAGQLQPRRAQSLWISATLDSQWLRTVDHPAPERILRVCPNASRNSRLARLFLAPKKLIRSPIAPASSNKKDISKYIKELAEAVIKAHCSRQMTIVIVNRVDRAQHVRLQLELQLPNDPDLRPTLALIHSRFRHQDRKREMDKVLHKNNWSSQGCIVVATQAVEAGVDVSACVMFVEIAPWPSMVQRFGRVNRYAEFSSNACVHWIDLLRHINSDKKQEEYFALPYEPKELSAARMHLAALSDVSPANLPPSTEIRPVALIRAISSAICGTFSLFSRRKVRKSGLFDRKGIPLTYRCGASNLRVDSPLR